MRNNLVPALLCLLLPALLAAQGNPARGVPYYPSSATFSHVLGAYTSSRDACTISSSPDLVDFVLEYQVFTRSGASSEWESADSGTIQQAGYDLTLCYPGSKRIMVILSCKQKNGGSVTFSSSRCKQ